MKKLRSIPVLIVALLIGLLASLACGASTDAPPASPGGGISVSGTASISLAPDIATLVLGVEAQDESVAQARADAAEAMAGIVDVLNAAGIEDKDIQTQRLSIQPQYDYSKETRKLIGFSVNNIVNVTIKDIDSVGSIIDGSVEAGGDLTRVQSIYFSVDDTSSHEDQLVADAVQDATDKAQHLADLTGVALGKPISINYGSGVPYPVLNRSFAVAMDESIAFDTSVSPGEIETSVTVNILFSIE